MKFTYVGEVARKTIELSPGNLFVMEKGVSIEVPDELAQKLLRTPGYRCDTPSYGSKGSVKDDKSDAQASHGPTGDSKQEKADAKAADKAERAAEKAADKA